MPPHNPFNLSDATIRDLDHVLVQRVAGERGSVCTYRKRFKAEGLSGADYWQTRENAFLLDFANSGLPYVQQFAEFKRDIRLGKDTPLVSLLATFDAGITIEDWLRVRPRYGNNTVHEHPFQHAGLFLELLRACLQALRTIHAHGIVHCDIKADNICLPYAPYPFDLQSGDSVSIDFKRVRLIDFAFSVKPSLALKWPLPIAPTADYQSQLFKTALTADQSGKRGPRYAVEELDWRADLYSLGHMANRMLDTGLQTPTGKGGYEAIDKARDLVQRLLAFDGGKRPKPGHYPHDAMIAEIDSLLNRLSSSLASLGLKRLPTAAAIKSCGRRRRLWQLRGLCPSGRNHRQPQTPRRTP